MTLLATAFRQCGIDPAPSARPLDDWDFSELAEHLHHSGVEVRLRSTREDGAFDRTVFLTVIDKDWNDLNALNKDARRIREWHGVVSCERMGENVTRATHVLGDRCLVVGPFLFYGDAEMLQRVRTALAPLAPPAAP
jgi:hypothetical protein